uniref:CCHC-type domain-containing protein n=1 Tax=Solanum tuberosum TaxID=4113 RepID=M1DJH6_SOLTU
MMANECHTAMLMNDMNIYPLVIHAQQIEEEKLKEKSSESRRARTGDGEFSHSRVMELPECKSTHWKSKSIDGLPTLFAERVRKSLRGDNTSINYEKYTYGKFISACVQEGLSLCNEIKLNQQITRHRLNERQQLGEFCEQFAFDIPKQKSKDKEYTPKKNKSYKKDYEKWKKKRIENKLRRAEESKGNSSKRKKKYRHNYKKSDTCHKCGRFGHYANDCRVKEKKNLDIDDNIKDSLYKIMLNSDSGKSESDDSSSEESSTSEDIRALQQENLYKTSEDECLPCQQGLKCEEEEEDDLYKIYSQFKDLSLNVIDNDDVLDLLKNIKDPEVRAQIIDKISSSSTRKKKDHIPEEIPSKDCSYTMAEVKNLLLERRKLISSPTTISDLKEEINNLKKDIVV